MGGIRRRRDRPNLDGYVDVGVTHLIMGISGPEWDLSLLPKLVEWRDSHRGRRGELHRQPVQQGDRHPQDPEADQLRRR